MKKTSDTTTDMNHEQALVDFVVTPNIADDDLDEPDSERALKQPKPQSKSRPNAIPTDEAPPEPSRFSESYPGTDMTIKAFQQLFAKMGKWNVNKLDGKMDSKLANLGREIEIYIANKTNNKSIIGTIIASDGSKFNTTASDVGGALKLIERYNENQKGAKYSMDDRLVGFANIMHRKK